MLRLHPVQAFLTPRAALRKGSRLAEEGRMAAAFRLYARAARAGLAEAEFRVARCYLEGSGVPPSRAEALRWLERAATQGLVEAQVQLASLFVQGLATAATAGTPTEGRPAASLFSGNEPHAPDFKAANGGSLKRIGSLTRRARFA